MSSFILIMVALVRIGFVITLLIFVREWWHQNRQ